MIKRLLLFLLTAVFSFTYVNAQADTRLDWDRASRWNIIGSGANKAALIVQFGENDLTDHAYVWIYRWDTPEEEYDAEGKPTVSGETMIRAIAGGSYDLDILTQYTGAMGSTLCGIGVSYLHSVLDYIEYDFKGAREDSKVTFNYFAATGNQTSAPGNYTPDICKEAIAAARMNHVIDHPLNARVYGVPAYDYDHWGSDDLATFSIDDNYWQAGWYDGYWSYWTGTENLRRLSFSGLGMSNVPLTDGAVHAWIFTPLYRNESMTGDVATGAQLSQPLDYEHFDFSEVSGVTDISITKVTPVYYTLDGIQVEQPTKAGIYIERRDNSVRKILIK